MKKRLTLKKVTLKNLDDTSLQTVAGASAPATGCQACATVPFTCNPYKTCPGSAGCPGCPSTQYCNSAQCTDQYTLCATCQPPNTCKC